MVHLRAASPAPKSLMGALQLLGSLWKGNFFQNSEFLFELWSLILKIHITIRERCTRTINAINSNYCRYVGASPLSYSQAQH